MLHVDIPIDITYASKRHARAITPQNSNKGSKSRTEVHLHCISSWHYGDSIPQYTIVQIAGPWTLHRLTNTNLSHTRADKTWEPGVKPILRGVYRNTNILQGSCSKQYLGRSYTPSRVCMNTQRQSQFMSPTRGIFTKPGMKSKLEGLTDWACKSLILLREDRANTKTILRDNLRKNSMSPSIPK